MVTIFTIDSIVIMYFYTSSATQILITNSKKKKTCVKSMKIGYQCPSERVGRASSWGEQVEEMYKDVSMMLNNPLRISNTVPSVHPCLSLPAPQYLNDPDAQYPSIWLDESAFLSYSLNGTMCSTLVSPSSSFYFCLLQKNEPKDFQSSCCTGSSAFSSSISFASTLQIYKMILITRQKLESQVAGPVWPSAKSGCSFKFWNLFRWAFSII